MRFYTYIHYTSDGRPFYVGKGCDRRAWAKNRRSQHWHRVVAKHGLKIEIASLWESEEDAFTHERLLIESIRSMGFDLANHTDGGEGSSGWRHDALTVERIRSSNTGKKRSEVAIANSRAARADWLERRIHDYWTAERREKARIAVAGKRHPNFGKRFSEELRAKLSASKVGKNNLGKSRPVICIESGSVFPSSNEAARWISSMGNSKAFGPAISAAAKGKSASAYGFTWRLA